VSECQPLFHLSEGASIRQSLQKVHIMFLTMPGSRAIYIPGLTCVRVRSLLGDRLRPRYLKSWIWQMPIGHGSCGRRGWHAAPRNRGPEPRVKRALVCCIFPANAAGAAVQHNWLPSTAQPGLGLAEVAVSFCRQNARLYFTCY
jgi:hypothetical protein